MPWCALALGTIMSRTMSADVTPQHYADMMFAAGGDSYARPSMRDFYLEQSSGRFTWDGQVSSWVRLDATFEEFGENAPSTGAGGDDANGAVYRVVEASLQALATTPNYGGGLDLDRADQVDRYDCDGDGVYFEPDGYIDHYALVHAGEGEEARGGARLLGLRFARLDRRQSPSTWAPGRSSL